MNRTIHQMPREKMLSEGVESLTDTELLALFLRTGTSRRDVFSVAHDLLGQFGSLYGLLMATEQEITAIEGIGVAKFAQLKGIAEMARRVYRAGFMTGGKLCKPSDTREFLQSQLACEEREIFMAIFLDNQNRILKHTRLFIGTLTHVAVHPREIVREAIKTNAAALILAHNHPSGNAEPSHADRVITEKVKKCCEFMEVNVLDHVIIGRGEYVSFAERGWI